jgi:hypothetical protein
MSSLRENSTFKHLYLLGGIPLEKSTKFAYLQYLELYLVQDIKLLVNLSINREVEVVWEQMYRNFLIGATPWS